MSTVVNKQVVSIEQCKTAATLKLNKSIMIEYTFSSKDSKLRCKVML